MDPFIAEIRIFTGNFPPKGWAFCNGQLLPISQNTALFSILGTMYGGDGRSNFGLPNLQDRVPIHAGTGPGLTPRQQGERGGSATVTLAPESLPPHSHPVPVSTAEATSTSPAGNLLAATGRDSYASDGARSPVLMNAAAVLPSGGGLPHNNLQPYLSLNFIIALVGIYPPRA